MSAYHDCNLSPKPLIFSEMRLIDNAVKHYKLRTSRNDDGIRKAFSCLLSDGFSATLTMDDINSASSDHYDLGPAVRLELARLECKREAQMVAKANKLHMELPLGPLKFLKYTRNIVLEHAIEIQQFNRSLLTKSEISPEIDTTNETISEKSEGREFKAKSSSSRELKTAQKCGSGDPEFNGEDEETSKSSDEPSNSDSDDIVDRNRSSRHDDHESERSE